MDSFAETQCQVLNLKGEGVNEKKIYIGIALCRVTVNTVG